jgi:hypothetical protein
MYGQMEEIMEDKFAFARNTARELEEKLRLLQAENQSLNAGISERDHRLRLYEAGEELC